MSSNKIVLTSSDGESFEIEEVVAQKMEIVAHMIEDDCVSIDSPIPLQNVNGKTLALILEYCKKHVEAEAAGLIEGEDEESKRKELDTWDAEFMKNMDEETIFKLFLAVNYINVKSLFDLACQTIADNMKDKKVEEVRTIFNIENDYTPEEEYKMRKENAWAFK